MSLKYPVKWISCYQSPTLHIHHNSEIRRGGRVMRWCWVNFQCRGVHRGQGLTALAVGAGGDCLHLSFLSFFSLSLGWLVGCCRFNGPLRQYFSLYRAVSQRGRKKREVTDERKNVQTTPTRTYCKYNRPLPYYNPN